MADVLVTGNKIEFLKKIIQDLQLLFSLKDLGALHYFLGIQIRRTTDEFFLNQEQYISDLLIKFDMDKSSSCPTTIVTGTNLCTTDSVLIANPSEYRSVLGALQYLTHARLDITFAVNKLSQFLHSPRMIHWQAVKRLLRYLQGSKSHGIFISGSLTLQLQGFSDADWAGSSSDRKSTGGYCVFFRSALISWSSKKQHTISRSSTESEYRVLANLAAKLL